MNRRIVIWGAFLVVLGATAPAAAGGRRQGFNTSMDDEVATCADIKVTYRGLATARSEEQRTIPAGSISRLEVRPHRNGGAYIRGWDRGEYSITACKAAADDDLASAQLQLERVRLSVQGDRVSIDGPEDGEWVGYLLIRVPQNASLDAETLNGPLALRDVVDATATLRATNGPIDLHNARGDVRVNTTNGPINVEGGGGRLVVRAQNGPLNVSLEGTHWDGDLEAHTQNGPLNLELPEGYQSSVRVDLSRNSPVQCRAPQCRQAVRTWEHPNRIEFGDSSPVVRLSTINGPVTIGGGKKR